MKRKQLVVGLISVALLAVLVVFLESLELDQEEYLSISWIVSVIVLLVIGNRAIAKGLDKIMPWSNWGSWRFILHIMVVLAYSLFVLNTTYYILKEWLTQDPPSPEQFLAMNLLGIILIIPVTALYFGFYFLRSWQSSEVRNQKLEKEQLKIQLDSLKNHLDPHFMFNNLNILSALIDKDAEASQKFLEKFAEVYRFLLQNKNSELVDLEQELQFLMSYYYLIECRYEDMVSLDNRLNVEEEGHFIPPFTLQMLFENGIKHNTITAKKPLHFELFCEEGTLVIRNNINPKMTPVESHKSGLDNIRSRYRYFTDKEVVVDDDGAHFTVRVPLVEVEDA